MAVGADQFALRDFLKDRGPAKSPQDHVAHLALLVPSGKVIPVHGGVMEHTTAIGATTAFLEASIPLEQLASMPLPLLNPLDARTPPVLSVV